METKKGLNATQRKMLDEIYTEQFEKRAKVILSERGVGREKLQDKLVKEQLKDKEIKKFIEAGQTFYKMQNDPRFSEKLKTRGLSINTSIHSNPKVSISTSYYNTYELPELEKYNERTREIEQQLSEKKKEMRAKIYGVEASYEEVDKEIKALLKDI